MQAAFIVKLDLPETSPDTLSGTAADIQESLELDGHPVLSVAPWTRPSEVHSVNLFDPTSPPSALPTLPSLG